MKAIILAGGAGTRLRERVKELPKPMAPVAGRPFLEYLLDKLLANGIADVVLSVGYKANTIQEYFGSKYKSMSVQYVVEDEPLGTGGAIKYAFDKIGNESALVLNGDTFLNLNYSGFLNYGLQRNSLISMVLKEVEDVSRFGSVIVNDGEVIDFLEKGTNGKGFINSGVYLIDPGIFKVISNSKIFSFEVEVLQKKCKVLKPTAYFSNDYFIDIGVPDEYDRAQIELPKFV